MKLTSAEKLHHAWEEPDGRVHIQYWNHRMNGQPGFTVNPEPGDGLRVLDEERVAPGYVLYSPDHSNRFLLLNVQGEIVHEWPAWTSHFGYMLPNGHLLLDTEFSPHRDLGIVELDWDGNEVWSCPCQVHHDFQRLDNGHTMVLCQREIERPQIGEGTLLSTYLYEVTPECEVVWEWYSEDHTEELTRLVGTEFPRPNADWTHSNTVQVIPETPASRDPRFKPGNVMVSHRETDCAVVIERATGDIVWAWGPGVLSRQHATIMIENGHMICFDNGTHRGHSAIWEVEPVSGEIVWSYKGTPPESFFARALSNAQRLPNGNTFICSGSPPDDGRLFEVTPDGDIVWDFQNPYAEYAQGERRVYRAYKYPPEVFDSRLPIGD